jgi:hypothetical protein
MSGIVFDIDKPAPTQQMLDAEISNRRIWLVLGQICVVLGIVTFGCIIVAMFLSLLPLAGILTVLFAVAIWIGSSIFDDKSTDKLDPISPSVCREMLEHCSSTESSRAYAADVISQGRQFVVAESTMMRAVTKAAADDIAFKTLYKITS